MNLFIMARAVSILGLWALLPALSLALPATSVAWTTTLALAEAVEHDDLGSEGEVSLLQTNTELKKRVISRSSSLSVEQASAGATADGPEKISIVSKAVIVLVVQFLAIHFLGAIARLWDMFRGNGKSPPFGERLGSLSPMIPLVCVLLVTMRTRAAELTSHSHPWAYGLPQLWVEASIAVAVIAGVLAMAFRMLALACAPREDSEEGPRPRSLVSGFLAGCCALFSGVMFLGVGIVLVATIFMDQPYDVWLSKGRISLSLALICMQHIVVQAFVICAVWMVSSSIQDLAANPSQGGADIIAKSAQAGSVAQTMAPMICILFAAARIRYLQVQHSGPALKEWEQGFYYLAVNAALVNMVLVICSAAIREARATKLEVSSVSSVIMRALIGLASLCMLIGIIGTLVSALLQKDPSGWQATPEFSCVLTCTLVLCIQYFGVHIISFLGNLCKPRASAGEPARTTRALNALARGEEANAVCPILCSLFLAASLRASEFGALPQGWVQNSIMICIGASVVHLFFVIATSMAAESAEIDQETNQRKHKASSVLLAIGQFVTLAIVYVGVAAVISGLVHMSAESLGVAK